MSISLVYICSVGKDVVMKKTIAILGCGYLGNVVADAWVKGLLADYEIIAAYSRTYVKTVALAGKVGAKACESIEELLECKADYLVETASVAMLKEVAVKALEKGTSVVPLSIGAFADDTFLKDAKEACARGNAKIHIPAGAVGGFDVLQTVSLMAEAYDLPIEAGISTRKGPKSLRNTPLFEESLMTEEVDKQVFFGTAKEAIALLPTKVNVAVASALATIGPDKATSRITSVPGMVGDDHRITAKIEGVTADVDIYSATSEIAGWSVVALLRNIASDIVFY